MRDSVGTFCEVLGLPRPSDVSRSNLSLDAVETEIFRQLNAANVPDPASVDLEAIFADMPLWSDRRLYGEVTDLAGLSCSQDWAYALQRLSGFSADQVASIVRKPPPPVYNVEGLRGEIAARLREISQMAA